VGEECELSSVEAVDFASDDFGSERLFFPLWVVGVGVGDCLALEIGGFLDAGVLDAEIGRAHV